jgi:hypothetical protein
MQKKKGGEWKARKEIVTYIDSKHEATFSLRRNKGIEPIEHTSQKRNIARECRGCRRILCGLIHNTAYKFGDLPGG